MANETVTGTTVGTNTRIEPWQGGVVAGLAGGAVMGIMLTMQMTPVIENAIPALYGLSGGAAGWVIHMVNSAIFGVVFAAIADWFGLTTFVPNAVVGLVYGVVLWAIFAVLVMPAWLGAVGFPGTPPFPNVNVMSLVGHLVFGVVAGAVYPLVTFEN